MSFKAGGDLVTRLKEEDVTEIGNKLEEYDSYLKNLSGMSLKEIGIKAAGKEGVSQEGYQYGVVPVTAGEGEISGFVDSVKHILEFLNFKTEITIKSDVAGLEEALRLGMDVVFLADDNKFIAKNLKNNLWVDNDQATALAYITALEGVAGALRGRRVLVLGAGRIGCETVRILLDKGVCPVVTDIDKERLSYLRREFDEEKLVVKEQAELSISDYNLLFDATPAGNIITADDINKNTYLAAPGIPAGFTGGAANKLENRLIHDPLQLGVAAMAFLVI